MLKASDNKSPTLEEPTVKCEKLGAVNHGDAEGSNFFCIHLLPKSESEIQSPKTDCLSISQSIGGMVSLTN